MSHYLETDFDGKVRESIMKLLDDQYDFEFKQKVTTELLKNPLDYPAEMREWIPHHIESSNVQLPISQVVGNFLTAETTSELGGSIHGRTGMVRGGPAPYDFFSLTYDDVYGKWVSNFIRMMGQVGTGTTSSGSFTYVDGTELLIIPYRPFDTAGIKAQFRLMAFLGNTGGSQTACTLAIGSFNTGETPVTGTLMATIANVGSGAFRDSGWVDHPPLGVADFIAGAAEMNVSGGSGSVAGLNVFVRWVSK